MTTLENRIKEFKTVCKALNLRREYGENFSGDEKWAIITALSDKELQEQFGDVVNACYSPYLLLSLEQGAAIIEQKRSEKTGLCPRKASERATPPSTSSAIFLIAPASV